MNQDEEVCQQDCLEDPSSPTCGGAVESWNSLYDTAEACCAYKLFWLSPSTCVQQSLLQEATGSEKWYVDWVLQKVSIIRVLDFDDCHIYNFTPRFAFSRCSA